MDGLLFLFLLVLAVPICLIALFTAQGSLRARIAKLEAEVYLLRAARPELSREGASTTLIVGRT